MSNTFGLIMPCSEVKVTKKPGPLVPFHELYHGPLWLQLKAAGFDWSRVGCVSAGYGFLAPPDRVRGYDRKMDSARANELILTGDHVSRLVGFVAALGVPVYHLGGELYRRLGRAALERAPRLPLRFVEGSYLQQRARLGELLRQAAQPSLFGDAA